MTHNEGNTKYRLQRLMASRQWLIRAETFIAGKPQPLIHIEKITDVGQDEEGALVEGLQRLRPKVKRGEELALGRDVSLPPDPVVDRIVARERAQREKAEEARRRALDEAQAHREAAARQLDEANPMWGMF
ncbi:hypothetical protein SAMN03159338_1476 [Sphingomonas sp. NFR04]|uniref:hypothetical protein n=1 Tax=Sphingomonas sp. NFR04 TaxID=1566283 RepID=UPI0008E6D10F|nr:hypothetical protein [Sphingomonas sp. NFR04]SFJ46980.1 hypothetical protein SAMN03159338_1476 [Sphingomonas sp. NFR04]